jgi:Na+-transporting NADH:ubiquinone oxidoreductase subunit C
MEKDQDKDKARKEGKFKKKLFPVVFMLAVTLVFISITTSIYTITKDTIALNATLVVKRAVLYSSGIEVPEIPGEIDALYNNRIREVRDENERIMYYQVLTPDASGIESYVMTITGSGLWGDITAAVGLSDNLSAVTGIEIIDQNETPGLGGRITEQWFKNQFRGKKGPISSVPEGEPAGERQFQAITGASYSTSAIKNIINATLEKAPKLIKIS